MHYDNKIIDSVKTKDIVQYLESLGYPRDKKHSGQSYIFFKSPLRNIEKTASFAVKIRTNTWFDYGVGRGGNIISLCMELEHLSFPKAIERLTSIPLYKNMIMREYVEEAHKSSVEVLEVKTLSSSELISYLKSRKIDEIAYQYIKEVKVNNKGKIWSAIGFLNDKNSWELRNKYIKISLAPKDITIIRSLKSKDCIVFEGFMDFLSYISYYNNITNFNVFVLNSICLVGRVEWNMIQGNIYYYGDNDKGGDECLRHIERGIDMRHVFAPYKDFNEFLVGTYPF